MSDETTVVSMSGYVKPRVQEIRDLKCYAEVYEMVVTGRPIREAAALIQERGEMNDGRKVDAVMKALYDWIKELPPADVARRNQSRMSKPIEDKLKQWEHGIYDLQEMEWLYGIQKKRLSRMEKAEREARVTNPDLDRSILVAQKISREKAELKFKLGILRPHQPDPGAGDEGEEQTPDRLSNPVVKKVLASPESRRKILGVLTTLLNTRTDVVPEAD